MDGPKTAVASWKTQYMLTVSSDHGSPSGGGWKDAGASSYAHLDTGEVPGGIGEQYVFTAWGGDATGSDYTSSDPILMDGPKTAVANWKTQYILVVTSDHGSPSGGGWKDAGTTAYAHLDTGTAPGGTGTQYAFTGWSGGATGSDYTSSDPILMDGFKTAVANWKTQYMLTVSSDHGSPSGDGWKDEGTEAHAHLDTGTVPAGPGLQYVFTEWSGDATGTDYSSSDPILMNAPKTAVANWQIEVSEYYLTVESDHANPSGEGWYPPGAIAHAHLDAGSAPGDPGTRYVFTHWGGDASGTDYSESDDIIMDASKMATANWKTQHMLTVESEHGGPSGDGWKDEGSMAQAHLDGDTFFVAPDTAYVFTHWSGDATGTNYAASDDILMDGLKTAVANWDMVVITSVEIPSVCRLSQNFPNPFNPSTTILFDMSEKGRVTIKIYNVGMQLVRTLVDDVKDAGAYRAVWDGTNNQRVRVASGVYFYKMETGRFKRTRKMILIR
jgi:hypothetical protein